MRGWLVFPTVAFMGCSQIIGIRDVPDPLGDAMVDTGMLDSPAEDGSMDSPIDMGADNAVIADGGPCVVDANACSDLTSVPAGWTPVILSTTKLSCPAGFGGSNVHVDPVTMPGACTCTATNTVAPTCVNGNITRANGNGCGIGQGNLAVTGGCNAISGNVDFAEQATTVAPGGSCTSTPQANGSKLTDSTASLCNPAQCPNDVCAGLAPQGYLACIQTTGDAACPSTGPFKNQRLVGDMMGLDCSAACNACTATATCTSPMIYFFSDTGCSSSITSVAADSLCHVIGVTTTFGSVKYAASPSNIQYNAAGPGTAKVTRTNAKTVCCK